MKLPSVLKNELDGWKKAEVAWLFFCIAVIAVVSFSLNYNMLGMASAITGSLYTIIAGKGKRSCYFFGIVNTVCYGIVSIQSALWGEAMLNLGYYLPMMFVGFFCWQKKLNASHVILKTSLTLPGRIWMALLSLAGIMAYAVILQFMGDKQPIVDSTTTVLSVTAMIMTVKRCIEQWLLWTIVNALSTYMWYIDYLKGGNNASAVTIAMWAIALANGIIFYMQWRKEVSKCPNTL